MRMPIASGMELFADADGLLLNVKAETAEAVHALRDFTDAYFGSPDQNYEVTLAWQSTGHLAIRVSRSA